MATCFSRLNADTGVLTAGPGACLPPEGHRRQRPTDTHGPAGKTPLYIPARCSHCSGQWQKVSTATPEVLSIRATIYSYNISTLTTVDCAWAAAWGLLLSASPSRPFLTQHSASVPRGFLRGLQGAGSVLCPAATESREPIRINPKSLPCSLHKNQHHMSQRFKT